ncbi:MAG: 5-formyltetrahydrofolate cyclo-ligase [Pyrinomonadaceae bacterium]|nr:5-formyltetrahydrofolate cyclo-ligase [Sphingobacteriaceae bacterium]
MNKKDLRALYLQKRKDLHPQEMERLSESILERFSSLSFQHIHYLHLFYPITGKHEFNSLLLVNWLKVHQPQIKLVLPKSNFEDNTLSTILWEEETPLAMNQWGITEPVHGTEIAEVKIDMVLVPLVALDKNGNRLGYGKGFYDRFLSTCRPDTQKVGISFFEPEEQFAEVNAFDVPLSKCICPDKIWEF